MSRFQERRDRRCPKPVNGCNNRHRSNVENVRFLYIDFQTGSQKFRLFFWCEFRVYRTTMDV